LEGALMAFVPDQAIDRSHELSGSAFRLYCYYCKRRDREGVCWPSLKRSAEDLRMAYTYVCEMRKELVREGWIELLKGGEVRPLVGFEAADRPSENPNESSENPNHPSEFPNSEKPKPSENPNLSSEKPNESSEIPNGQKREDSEIPKMDSEKPNRKFGNSEFPYRKNQPMKPAQRERRARPRFPPARPAI
jgi:hypothetical protein